MSLCWMWEDLACRTRDSVIRPRPFLNLSSISKPFPLSIRPRFWPLDTAAAAAKVLNSGAMKPLEAGGLKAFITTFRSGHTAIVQRRGAERLPVKKLLSPAVPHMMGNEEVRAEAEALAYETLQREIGKRIEQLTGAKA